MSLASDIEALRQAVQLCAIRRQAYASAVSSATDAFNYGNGPTLERAYRALGSGILGVATLAGQVARGAYAALMSRVSTGPNRAIRSLGEAREAMVRSCNVLERTARGVVGAARQALNPATALAVREALEAAVSEDSQVQVLVQAHRASRWGIWDPASLPIWLVPWSDVIRSPASRQSLYATLMGEEFAAAHPLSTGGNGGGGWTLPWWVPVGAGAALAAWLVFKDFFRR